ncbi:DUF6350 family protein [Solwaraspora sp. WMMB335]|uniref:cell division protein PerM n=1 Tax=Solwaraspora sp. WMMB335 TaxID=3404118 RepID=UPI003B9629CE
MAAHPPDPPPRSLGRTAPSGATRPERSGAPRRGRPPLALAATVTTLWAAVVSYLPVAVVMWLVRLAEGDSSITGAAQAGLAAWLLGHGVPLDTPTGPLGLPPLLLSVLAAWRICRAGVHTTRAIGARRSRSPLRAGAVAIAVGLVYGAVGVAAATVASSPSATIDPVRSGVGLAAFGAVAALLGAGQTTGALHAAARRCPTLIRQALRTGLVAALLMFAAGAAAAGLSVAINGGDAADTIGAYRAGVAGQAGITVLSLAYSPNATVWAAAYLLGPGFAVGTGTAVRTSEVSLGSLPAVPLFAGLPNGPVGGLSAALLALPVLAAMTAGWVLARRRLTGIDPAGGTGRSPRGRRPGAGRPGWVSPGTGRPGWVSPGTGRPGWVSLLVCAAASGPVAGAIVGVGALASGGPLGAGRLAEIGPTSWQTALAACVVASIGTAVGAAAARAVAAPPDRPA